MPVGRPPRRYATKGIWLGMAAATVTTTTAAALGLWAAIRATTLGSVVTIVLSVVSIVPLVLGIVLAAMEGSPVRRGFGLGAIIGWALSPIVLAGVCFVIVVGAYSQEGSR